MTEAGIPCCRSSQDIDAAAGRRVRLIGKYVEVDLRQKPKPPPRFEGHAGIRLKDGELVMLEPSWSGAAIRSRDERRRLAGRQVAAVGTLWADPPEPPEPCAYVLGPCLTPVESVEEERRGGG